jgi:predicted amidohydrolase
LNEKHIATIALRDGEYESFSETLSDATNLIQLAAAQGAELVVLPETINLLHRHDGTVALEALALDNWQTATAELCRQAAQSRVALALPLLVIEEQGLANCFYLLDRDGTLLGEYRKRALSPGEVAGGIVPGTPNLLHWDGLRIGGAICFDLYYPQAVLEPQVAAGADCFLIPSMTPGGSLLDAYAVSYGTPFVLAYSAWSRILDRDGRERAAGGYRSETLRAGFGSPIQQAIINFDSVTLFADFNQSKIRDVLRHYGAKVRVRFNQPDCTFLLESRSHEVTVAEVMHEFGLVSRRDYFAHHAPPPLPKASGGRTN